MSFASFTDKFHHEPYPAIDPKRPELSAAGKFVVITGGGSGIGEAAAVAFAQAGAKIVAILGRRVSALESAAAKVTRNAVPSETQVLFESVDLSDRTALNAAVQSLVERANGAKVDVLVHSAGIAPNQGPVLGTDEAEFQRGFQLNVLAAFNTIQAFIPVAASDLTLINVSSGMVHIKPWLGDWVYATNKAAVSKMLEYVQDENPEFRILQYQPGVIATYLNERFNNVVSQDVVELPGQFAVWLASPEAGFLKGKWVWANWDVEELKARATEIQDSWLLRIVLNGVVM